VVFSQVNVIPNIVIAICFKFCMLTVVHSLL